MCIISLPVEEVSQTKILVGVDKSMKQQIVVYSNEVNNTSESNAMVLPVPNPHSVKFIDLSNYKNIFTDLSNAFEQPVSRGFSTYSLNSKSSYSDSYDTSRKLDVINVGSYKVSLAMNLRDLKRVDETVFKLSDGCYDLLKSTYASNQYGFIICKLVKGNEAYHPMAYSHDIIGLSEIFVPTKHYHDHTRVSSSVNGYDAFTIDSSPMFSNFMELPTSKQKSKNSDSYIAEDWSHEIYLVNCSGSDINEMSKKSRSNYYWKGYDPIAHSKIKFDFGQPTNFEKHKIHGTHANIDLLLRFNPVPQNTLFRNKMLPQTFGADLNLGF